MGDKRETEFAYYKDLYIENQKNVSGEFIKTATARAPRNYFSNGYNFWLTSLYDAVRNHSLNTFIYTHLKDTDVTFRSEPAFFYFIFDPAIVSDFFKTKLTNRELAEGGRCSHLKRPNSKLPNVA